MIHILERLAKSDLKKNVCLTKKKNYVDAAASTKTLILTNLRNQPALSFYNEATVLETTNFNNEATLEINLIYVNYNLMKKNTRKQ